MKRITVNEIETAECEDCHKPIVPFQGIRWGFVSPESSSYKQSNVNGIAGIEAMEKVVCKKCYYKAFKRVYPGASVPPQEGGETYEKTFRNSSS